jgi:hypothetical protein
MNTPETPRVIHDCGAARVIQSPRDRNELVVQRRRDDGEWEDVTHYNEISNDYAHTDARSAAERYARSYP